MNLGKFFAKEESSAKRASERLKLVLEHERGVRLPYLEEMKCEILEVIKKYTHAERIDIKADSNQQVNTLEVEITLGQHS
ncbi:MAG: cell division topological specificity factor MinE [Wolinella sp.]